MPAFPRLGYAEFHLILDHYGLLGDTDSMRYAVIEILPPAQPDGLPVLRWVATDLCLSSANDCIKAWGYQAGQRGGYMERIEDTQEAFDARKRDANRYAFYSKRTLGADGKPVNQGEETCS